MAGPPLSSERGQYGSCSPSPNGYDGRLSDGVRRSFSRADQYAEFGQESSSPGI